MHVAGNIPCRTDDARVEKSSEHWTWQRRSSGDAGWVVLVLGAADLFQVVSGRRFEIDPGRVLLSREHITMNPGS